MCSRYTVKRDEGKIRLRDKIVIYGAVPREDIRPTDLAPILIPDDDNFQMTQMRWGWRVPWDKSPLINAKSETLLTLKTYAAHLQNRCLILADGFYEKGIRFIQPGGGLFAMAGIWQPDGDGKKFTMLTTTPNETVSPYHHRMPFILHPDQWEIWLGGDWKTILDNPDKRPLDKIQKQAELF